MKEPIVQTVIKGNGFIYEISNPQTEALFLKTFRSVPRCPTVHAYEPGQWDRTVQ